jgi:hypothetical protein
MLRNKPAVHRAGFRIKADAMHRDSVRVELEVHALGPWHLMGAESSSRTAGAMRTACRRYMATLREAGFTVEPHEFFGLRERPYITVGEA